MFGTLGGPEVILILVVALIVFGPRRLPEIGKSMGKMLAEFRKASNDFKRTIDDELEAEKAKETQVASPLPPAEAPVVHTIPAPPPYASEPPPMTEESAPEIAGGGTSVPAAEPTPEPPAEPVVSRSADEK
jgi:TatA/E family protein of Tat protein translocase